jgi:DNA-directed RNA polymerase specialized sigma24 family protein
MDMRKAVRKAIKQLPSHYQELIHRVYFKGESVLSISKEKGCSSQALDKQLKNAKNKLKEILKNFSF